MVRGRRGWIRGVAGVMLLAVVGGMAGCELLYLAGPRPKNAAAFKFPKGHHVLVLVEVGEGVAVPPSFTTTLADAVGTKLWQNKALDAPLIRQDRLIALQQANPAAYAGKTLGDIAHDLGADDLLYIHITQLQTTVTADGSVADGGAEAFVKVLDKDGNRIWPGDVKGQRITAQVSSALLSDRDIPSTIRTLSGLLADHTDILFHETPADERHVGQ